MTNTAERAKTLANHCREMGSDLFLGVFSSEDLTDWVQRELGDSEILDRYTQYGNSSRFTKALPHSPVLHILSGNTEHAGHQSLLRGILIGAQNIVKLPSSGLPSLEAWIKNLPPALKQLVTITDELDDEVFQSAKTLVAIGSDQTMREIQQRVTPKQRFIPHGHKLSIGLIQSTDEEIAKLVVNDACAFNQQGCLSLHSVYLIGDEDKARAFLPLLADAMTEYEINHPRGEISISESGSISNLRESTKYEAANDSKNVAIMHSEGNTAWTAIYRNSPTLSPSPLNRVITIQPWPGCIEKLGPEQHHLSTIAIERELISPEIDYKVARICTLGRSQKPALDWHHDGFLPLGSLVSWLDLEL